MIAIRSGEAFLAIAAVRQAAAESGPFTSGRIAEAAAALVTGTLAVLMWLRSRQAAIHQAAIGPADPALTRHSATYAPTSSSNLLPTLTLPVVESDAPACSMLRRLGTAVLFGLTAGFLAPGPVAAAVLAAVGFASGYVVAGRSASAKAAKVVQRRLAAAPPAIELFAAGLAAGMLPEHAANAVVEAFGRVDPIRESTRAPTLDRDQDPLGQVAEIFRRAAANLADTADPTSAWEVLRRDPATEPVGTAALRSSRTGAPMAESVTRAAEATRLAAQQAAQGQVRSVAVKAVAPLALCFLPAFVLIGVVPTALGLLHQFQH